MNTEQERAEFEARVKAEQGLDLTRLPHGGYRSFATHQAWWAWQARAALQSQVKNDRTLFCDLKTDEEKSAFFLSGRGYETGVIAYSIQNDVAMAYHRCSEYRKEMEALQAECEKLRKGKAAGWVSVDDALPELGIPVWLKTGHSVFIGGRVDHPDGWLWGRCYYEPWINKDGEWEGDIECYDNHMVTAWHPLPVPPVTMTEDRA